MIKRIESGESHVFTTPLIINKATGVKFGKSEAGAVWLDPTLTTPYQFYQFWLNTDDESAKDLITKYTLLTKDIVEDIIAKHDEAPQKRLLQHTLAEEVTRIVHGEERVASVKAILGVLFGEQATTELSSEAIDMLATEIPVVQAGTNLVDALNEAGVVTSNGEARRLIAAGAVKLNGEKTDDDQLVLSSTDLVKVGKNKFVLAR